MDKFDLVVSTAFGIESVTKRELSELGIDNAPAYDGRLYFTGDYSTIANLNINLRTADRVQIKMGEFSATTFDELFDGIKNSEIERYIPKDGRIIVNAKSVKSELFALSAIQSIGKKAIVERLKSAYKVNSIDENGAVYPVEIRIFKDNVTLCLDTSGSGLHKRGYRDKVWVAPLKETLAAAIIKLSVWNKNKALIDPFCGSGTIPIEAALMAHNIAPGLYRSFQYEEWSNFPQEVLNNSKTQAKDAIDMSIDTNIIGYDIDSTAIKLAIYHAERAGVKVNFEKKDMREVTSKHSYGVIISNPPYGERLLEEYELKTLYKDFYTMYKTLDNFSLYVLTASDRFEEYVSRRATKNRKLYNAQLECRLYTYMGEKPIKK